MDDQAKIDLMNHVVKLARPVTADEIHITSLDTEFKDTKLDSLDFLMIGIYLGDVYGVSEEDLKALQPKPPAEGEAPKPFTVRDVFNYMEQHATKQPANLQEAIASIV